VASKKLRPWIKHAKKHAVRVLYAYERDGYVTHCVVECASPLFGEHSATGDAACSPTDAEAGRYSRAEGERIAYERAVKAVAEKFARWAQCDTESARNRVQCLTGSLVDLARVALPIWQAETNSAWMIQAQDEREKYHRLTRDVEWTLAHLSNMLAEQYDRDTKRIAKLSK